MDRWLSIAVIAAPGHGAVRRAAACSNSSRGHRLAAIDRDSGKPIAVRVHLRNAKTDKPSVPGPRRRSLCLYDRVKLKLPLGSYCS
jgi:hypothetical protein